MRSMKVDPAAAVILTLIQSESTCVPPVTAERSPPDSRITGADSPVIAASLTEAIPSIISPSDGMMSPASTSTTSPTFRLVPGTSLTLSLLPLVSSLACVSVLERRSESACALPRPSATASAKFANRIVNQSQRIIWKEKPRSPAPVRMSLRNRLVVRTETTATTNITGFLANVRGLSFLSAPPSAGTRIRASKILADLDWLIRGSSVDIRCRFRLARSL